ncbi:hypothetical protein [Kineococcus sp. NPDC059986]|uniref:hypothetical protein n=1 Tax=Kineococcus sp. NPDC059986 TaxID=3155538 RepID=UPI00344B8DA1
MNYSTSPNAGGPADEAPVDSAPAAAVREPADPRVVKSLIGGAAAVAVLAAGTAGLLWLSSMPSGASAQALPGSPAASQGASVSVADVPPVPLASIDPFANNGVQPLSTVATTGGSASGPGTNGGSGGAAPGTSGSSTPSTGTRVSTAPGGASSNTTPPPPAKPVVTPKPGPSTAAPWQRGQVRFEQIPEGSAAGAAVFTLDSESLQPVSISLAAGALIPSTSTVYQPHGTNSRRPMTDVEKTSCEAAVRAATTVEAAEAIKRTTDGCTATDAFVWKAVFVPSSQAADAAKGQERFGWLVADETALPDAVMGKVTGTVRLLAQRDKSYLVQVNRDQPVWVKEGAAVPGTPLTISGTGLAEIGRDDVAVFSNAGTKYFTVPGGGEDVGVTY